MTGASQWYLYYLSLGKHRFITFHHHWSSNMILLMNRIFTTGSITHWGAYWGKRRPHDLFRCRGEIDGEQSIFLDQFVVGSLMSLNSVFFKGQYSNLTALPKKVGCIIFTDWKQSDSWQRCNKKSGNVCAHHPSTHQWRHTVLVLWASANRVCYKHPNWRVSTCTLSLLWLLLLLLMMVMVMLVVVVRCCLLVVVFCCLLFVVVVVVFVVVVVVFCCLLFVVCGCLLTFVFLLLWLWKNVVHIGISVRQELVTSRLAGDPFRCCNDEQAACVHALGADGPTDECGWV